MFGTKISLSGLGNIIHMLREYTVHIRDFACDSVAFSSFTGCITVKQFQLWKSLFYLLPSTTSDVNKWEITRDYLSKYYCVQCFVKVVIIIYKMLLQYLSNIWVNILLFYVILTQCYHL